MNMSFYNYCYKSNFKYVIIFEQAKTISKSRSWDFKTVSELRKIYYNDLNDW